MKELILVILLFTALTLVVTWPLVLHLNTLIIDPVDGLLITWFLNWDIHAMGQNLTNFYNANIFYPYSGSLAFSETMLPQALLVAPLVFFFREPLLAYNLNLLLGFILTGVTAYVLLRHLTKNASAACLFSVLITFSTIHLNYLAHLQLFNLWPVILAIYFLEKKKQGGFVLLFWVAGMTSVLFCYFLALIAIVRGGFKQLFLAGLVMVPFLLPYYFVSRRFGYSRPITDAIHNSLQFPDLANVSILSRLSTLIPQVPNTTPAFFGSVFAGLVLYCITIKNRAKKPQIRSWLWVAGLSFVLAFGPALHIFRNTIHVGPIPAIPLPYTVLYYLLPGFSGLRTPSRWIILTALALAITCAVILAKRINWKWSVLLCALVLMEVNFPFKYYPVPPLKEFPPEQVWLKDNYIGAPIIQFPIYGWFDSKGVGLETLREYYSTVHWHPMFNGYSGFSPKEWEDNVRWLQKNFPSGASIQFLKEKGIKLVVVDRQNWENRPYPGLRIVKEFEKAIIYEIY